MISPTKTTAPIIKGCSKNVIVVKSPAPMFSEALFILKDEPFRETDADSKALLKQAYAAARQYSAAKPRNIPWLSMAVSCLTGACAALLICIFF